MPTRSWREERQNTNSNSQESDNRHQDKHDEDSAVHQMVVPLGLAIFQLVPWLFVIIHREILDWMFLRYIEPFRMQTQNLLRLTGGHSRSKTPCAEVVFCPRFRSHFPAQLSQLSCCRR
jgi:hypothetical protein